MSAHNAIDKADRLLFREAMFNESVLTLAREIDRAPRDENGVPQPRHRPYFEQCERARDVARLNVLAARPPR